MTLTLSRLRQSHSKVAHVSGVIALAMGSKKLKRSELHICVANLTEAIALIESILNDKD